MSGGELEVWSKEFLAAVDSVYHATDPVQSAGLLRKLIKTKLLKFTDMRDAPEKFFLAHRLLSTIGLGGFGIRFTVQFNLFAGSILGLGGPKQVADLQNVQDQGQLGCFLLTEMQAGVLSGLIVETTAEWSAETQEFVLHTPSDRAAKNWISQGFVAELGVVIADLKINGKSHGPHPFIMKLRDGPGGALLPGIRIQDMGTKTVANDLDNARVWFDHVKLPKSSLLNKYADIVDNNYVQTTSERMRIEVIGQRLMTGRMAIAQAALMYAQTLHLKTQQYADSKVCNGLAGETSLASMPQLRAVFTESEHQLSRMASFAAEVEHRLNAHLRAGSIPEPSLVEQIAVCKIRCIDVALQRCHALRLEVGSYALMHNTGFELMDMLLTCKFAEGDSRILQQKLARDRLRALQKGGLGAMARAVLTAEGRAALRLARQLAPAGRDVNKLAKAMDQNWEELYGLADLICERHINATPPRRFIETCTERVRGADIAFDHAWKDKLATV